MMMDRVLGIPGIYDSAIITDPATYGPSPIYSEWSACDAGIFLVGVCLLLQFYLSLFCDRDCLGRYTDGEVLWGNLNPIRDSFNG